MRGYNRQELHLFFYLGLEFDSYQHWPLFGLMSFNPSVKLLECFIIKHILVSSAST